MDTDTKALSALQKTERHVDSSVLNIMTRHSDYKLTLWPVKVELVCVAGTTLGHPFQGSELRSYIFLGPEIYRSRKMVRDAWEYAVRLQPKAADAMVRPLIDHKLLTPCGCGVERCGVETSRIVALKWSVT